MKPEPTVTLTNEMIVAGSTSRMGTWSRRQLKVLGVRMPLTKGWKYTVIGTKITVSRYERFLALKGVKRHINPGAGFFPEFACTAKPGGYAHAVPRAACMGCEGESRPGSNYCGRCWDRLRAKLKPPKG